jgi:hypothetical protein
MSLVVDVVLNFFLSGFEPQLRRKHPTMFWLSLALGLVLPAAIVGLIAYLVGSWR